MLLRAINMSGKIHMVPALINDDYVIRFAVCAQHAVDDDVAFAWNVISEMATDVLAMCDTNKESETLKEFHRIESLEVSINLYALSIDLRHRSIALRGWMLASWRNHQQSTDDVLAFTTLSREH